MKKTLLIAAAALAAGIISSQAQVYSQNIVGYVNVAFPAGFTAAASPLINADTNNSATNVIPNIPDFSYVYVWNTNSSTYGVYLAYQGLYYDGDGNNVLPTPNLPVGLGYFVQAPSAFTNTYVGTVSVTTGAAGTVSTNTVNLVAGFNFVNPSIPIGGGVTTSLGIQPPDFTYVYVYNKLSQSYGVSLAYQGAWYDSDGNNVVPEPTVSAGQSFFVQPPSPFAWSMTFTNQ